MKRKEYELLEKVYFTQLAMVESMTENEYEEGKLEGIREVLMKAIKLIDDKYSNCIYRNKVDNNWKVTVLHEISNTKVKLSNGEIWSKNRLSRYWDYIG